MQNDIWIKQMYLTKFLGTINFHEETLVTDGKIRTTGRTAALKKEEDICDELP